MIKKIKVENSKKTGLAFAVSFRFIFLNFAL